MSKIHVIKTYIDDLLIIEPKVFYDERGFFMESYNELDFLANNLSYKFVQDNHSLSKKGVLRGLHFQKQYPQTKLVRVIKGEVFDVAVDLRKNSKTYGKWFGIVLSEDNKKQLLIPRGFAHGFLVLSESAEFIYKCDDFYHPEDECGIIYNDPIIGVEWPSVNNLIINEKDLGYPTFKDLEVKFEL